MKIVLTYHSISDGRTPISVSVKDFMKQIGFLKAVGARVLALEEFLAGQKGILITFDDAFKDVYENALPILKKYNFPAVIFINPSLVGGAASFATREEDRTRRICSLAELRELAGNNVSVANHGYSHRQLSELSTAEVVSEYEQAYAWIKNNFIKNSFPNVFVFPKGAKNDGVKKVLRDIGATILDNRVDVYSDTSIFGFMLKINPVYAWLRRKIVK